MRHAGLLLRRHVQRGDVNRVRRRQQRTVGLWLQVAVGGLDIAVGKRLSRLTIEASRHRRWSSCRCQSRAANRSVSGFRQRVCRSPCLRTWPSRRCRAWEMARDSGSRQFERVFRLRHRGRTSRPPFLRCWSCQAGRAMWKQCASQASRAGSAFGCLRQTLRGTCPPSRP